MNKLFQNNQIILKDFLFLKALMEPWMISKFWSFFITFNGYLIFHFPITKVIDFVCSIFFEEAVSLR